MNNRIASFAPIISENSKILILGSVPGVKSLEMQQYYAHPQNQFWKILFKIFEENFTNDYSERISFLHRHHIALWDVIETCERKGSLDSDIRNEEANKISELLATNPQIKAVFCNGQKSFKNFKKIAANASEIPFFLLPSTSPAFAMMKFEDKAAAWMQILQFL